MKILVGDCREIMATLKPQSVQCCVTSPPYWGLRDYAHPAQLGLEQSPEEYVANLLEVFRGVHRVLRDDGTLWLNLGDSFANKGPSGPQGRTSQRVNRRFTASGLGVGRVPGLKPKDMVGIPWRVALALQADGWYLRSDVIWSKTNAMPESVTDRPTRAHEYVFLLSKSPRYLYDADAIKEHSLRAGKIPGGGGSYMQHSAGGHNRDGLSANAVKPVSDFRNKRSVWSIATEPFPGTHFAVMPTKLVEPCILAGSRLGDTVLDPFSGAGTVGLVSLQHGRKYVGCELNEQYAAMSEERISQGLAQSRLFTPMGDPLK